MYVKYVMHVMHVCMYACTHASMYVCMYGNVCMVLYVCMYACMYACMYVCASWSGEAVALLGHSAVPRVAQKCVWGLAFATSFSGGNSRFER